MDANIICATLSSLAAVTFIVLCILMNLNIQLFIDSDEDVMMC